jgi:hypothetical protein
MAAEEAGVIPHYFVARLDAETRTPSKGPWKLGFRHVSKSSDERSLIASVIRASCPCGNQLPVLCLRGINAGSELLFLQAWASSFIADFITRLITLGHANLHLFKRLPCPYAFVLPEGILPAAQSDDRQALFDSVVAEQFELSHVEFAYILSTFPLLDRDQPPLPHDYRLRPTNKGLDRRPISFVTRDLALLTYLDYLAGRLEVKPDPARVSRICPEGVPDPPTDIVAFFAEAGVDIAGTTDSAVAETGPIRDLRERVALARELGAVAYVPTIDRRRASFVERAAAAGGLSPDEGVLTPEMARWVLRDKAEREARWQRAMRLWENTSKTSTPEEIAARMIE